jgi:hypothetical protein
MHTKTERTIDLALFILGLMIYLGLWHYSPSVFSPSTLYNGLVRAFTHVQWSGIIALFRHFGG